MVRLGEEGPKLTASESSKGALHDKRTRAISGLVALQAAFRGKTFACFAWTSAGSIATRAFTASMSHLAIASCSSAALASGFPLCCPAPVAIIDR